MAGSNGHDFRNLLTSQVPPHNEDAERRVLGACILDRQAYSDAQALLGSDDFFRPEHGQIWGAIGTIYATSESDRLSTLELADNLRRSGLLEEIGGLSYLEYMQDSTPTIQGTKRHAELVHKAAIQRQMIEVFYQATQRSLAGTEAPKDILEDIGVKLTDLESACGQTPEIVEYGSITFRPTRWIWPDRIPLGKVTLLDGDPDLGKSTIALDLIARVTQNSPMPDDTSSDIEGPRGAVLVTVEDDPEDTIGPRLAAAGADLDRVLGIHMVTSASHVYIPTITDLTRIRRAIEKVDAALLVIDPLMAHLPANTNTHRDSDIRQALAPLAGLSMEMGISTLALRHWNKSGGSKALYRGGGSIGIAGLCRSGLQVTRHPEDDMRSVLASYKHNLAPRDVEKRSLVYRMETTVVCDDFDIKQPRIVWEGEIDQSPNELAKSAEMDDEERGVLSEACRWLHELLSQENIKAKELKKTAREVGISERTLERARARLRVQAYQPKIPGPWFVKLPGKNS